MNTRDDYPGLRRTVVKMAGNPATLRELRAVLAELADLRAVASALTEWRRTQAPNDLLYVFNLLDGMEPPALATTQPEEPAP